MTDIITTLDKFNCARRELSFRKYVYPNRVKSEKMSAGKAAREIAAMEAIVADYRALVKKERLL